MIYDLRNKPTGADEAYPLFVYGLQLANIKKLKSNLSYIENFRHRTRFESEESYYFTTISSAVQFIEKLSYSDVNMSEEEFQRLREAEKHKIAQERESEMKSANIKSKYFIKESFLFYF